MPKRLAPTTVPDVAVDSVWTPRRLARGGRLRDAGFAALVALAAAWAWTPLVRAACWNPERPNSATSEGTTAEAENHSAIAATCATAMIAIETAFERGFSVIAERLPPGSARQIFGSVTPCCFWYLPPRSLYEVSQTSSDSKKITCATPSFA